MNKNNIKPKVSIIMPCFNAERFISSSIKSILNQSFINFELIIIDDGSTDSTSNDIKMFKDSRIKYYHFKKNNGNSIARNKGLKLSVGKYISMIDAGDIVKPDCLLTQYQRLENNPKIGGLGTSNEIIDENGNLIGFDTPSTKQIHLKLLLIKQNPIPLSSLILRRRLLLKHNILFNENYKYAGDYEFIARLLKNIHVVNLSSRLIQCRIYTTQFSSTKYQEQMKFENRIRRKQLDIFTRHYTQEEFNLHIKLMTHSFMSQSDIENGVVWLNKLLEINHKHKLYPQKQLHDLLIQTIITARKNSSLGGWAIKKEMIDFIRTKLPEQKTIFEFGSGSGTNILLEHYKVISVEHDIKYIQKRGPFHTCYHVPIKNEWYNETILKSIMTGQYYDLILVDGPPGKLREGILNNLHLFKTIHCPVIFDDIDRELDLKTMNTFCDTLEFSIQIIKGTKKEFAYCIKKNK